MSANQPNAEIMAVLEAHRLDWQTFSELRSDSYEQKLAADSPEKLDAFYSLLFAPGLSLAQIAAQCPAWPGGTKNEGAQPTQRLLSEVATRWNGLRTLDVVDQVSTLMEKFKTKMAGLPNAAKDNVTDGLLGMLSQELMTAKLEGTSLSQQTRALAQLLKKQKLNQDQQELDLARDKFEVDAAKLALAAVTRLKTISASKLTDVEKIDQARRALFGALPEDQRVAGPQL